MSAVLVIAAHADDETLGCGGTLLRHRASGDELHWCIATSGHEPLWRPEVLRAKAQELDRVAHAYGFASVTRLEHPATALAGVPQRTLLQQLRELGERTSCEVVYCVSGRDAHEDHRALFSAATAAFKQTRSHVRRLLAYETLSSTDQAPATYGAFAPVVFVDVTAHLERKLEILSLYASEIGEPPFPRSAKAVEALARVRGAAIGVHHAEAFELVRERL